MAQRAVTRGAWSAPANELLRGVVALAPPLAAGRRLELQDAQVNIFRHEPRGFLSLGADTLSRDIDLRPINVRRLLILLRRLALRLGETYVFEPNDDSFRRLVQRGFEAALDATEEAVYNSLLKATDVTANRRTIRALPIEPLKTLLKKYSR